MAYYSEVAIALKKNDYEELKARAELLGYKIIETVDHLVEKPLTEVVILAYDYINWDKNDKEVKFIEDFISELEENGKPFKTMRLGERWDDVEENISYGGIDERDYSCDVLSVSHEIEIN